MDRNATTEVQQTVDNGASTYDDDRTGRDTRELNEDENLVVNEKKKKKKRLKSKQAEVWTSAEYRLVASDPNAPGFRPPHYKPPTLSPELNYKSSEYGTDTKKPSRHPWVPLKDSYLSEEYRKQYPLPLISIPGCPPGHTPQEGPWVQFYTSMWGTIWVSLKDTDTAEASQKPDWIGFNWRDDHIA